MSIGLQQHRTIVCTNTLRPRLFPSLIRLIMLFVACSKTFSGGRAGDGSDQRC